MNTIWRISALCALLGLVLTVIPPKLIASDGDGFTGTFEGSGRACYGKLIIKPKTISWKTPFSSCKNAPYEILEQTSQGYERRMVYALKRPDKGCRWGIVVLQHRDSAKPDLDWEAMGYISLADYQSSNEINSMSCYLYKTK